MIIDEKSKLASDLFNCECLSPYHRLVLQFFIDLNESDSNFPPEIYASFFIPKETNIFKRIVKGFRYILGLEPTIEFTDFILKKEDIPRLQEFLNFFIEKFKK